MFTVDLAEVEPIVMRAWGELDDYVDSMIDRRRHNLTEDLVSDLIRAEDDGDRLSSEELKTLAASLLMAGTDTTRNQLAASVQVLCEHPEQWALLHDHPELAMGAVEESMRHSPAVCGAPRMAAGDVEFGGFLFPSGTILQINTFAANRDSDVYDRCRAVRHPARRRTRNSDLRRRRPLLPGCKPRSGRACRGTDDPCPPSSDCATVRTRTVEAAPRFVGTDEPSDRIRKCLRRIRRLRKQPRMPTRRTSA